MFKRFLTFKRSSSFAPKHGDPTGPFLKRSQGTHLAAAVVAHVTFEPLLVLMGLLVLDQGVALMENGVAVTTLLSGLDEGVLLTKVDSLRSAQIAKEGTSRE